MNCSKHNVYNCSQCRTARIEGCLSTCSLNQLTVYYGKNPLNRAKDLKETDIDQISIHIYEKTGVGAVPLLHSKDRPNSQSAAFNRSNTYKFLWEYKAPSTWNDRDLYISVSVTLLADPSSSRTHVIADQKLCFYSNALYRIADPSIKVDHDCSTRDLTLTVMPDYPDHYDSSFFTGGAWFITWGDGSVEETALLFNPEDAFNVNHEYVEDGCYTIKFRIEHGWEFLPSCPYVKRMNYELQYTIDAENCPDKSPTLIVIQE